MESEGCWTKLYTKVYPGCKVCEVRVEMVQQPSTFGTCRGDRSLEEVPPFGRHKTEGRLHPPATFADRVDGY